MRASSKILVLAGLGVLGLAALGYFKRKEIAEAAPDIGEIVVTGTRRIVNRIVSVTTRGFRNNNPLNIKHGQSWQGETPIQQDATFESYVAPEYGFRAAARIMDTYRSRYGIATVQGVIARWAPAVENPVQNYIKYVADELGVAPSAPINLANENALADLLIAMTRFENNRLFPYERETVITGIRMARGASA